MMPMPSESRPRRTERSSWRQRVRLRDVMALFIVHHRLGVGERGLGRGGNLPRGRKRNRWDYGVAQKWPILYALAKPIEDFVPS